VTEAKPQRPGTFVKGQLKPNQGKRGPDKTTKIAKDVIAEAAAELGGMTRLVAWVREDPLNERAFWASIFPKLLPLQVTGEGGGPVLVAAVEWTIKGDDPTA
jgi:hypothetical protein